MEWRLSGQAQTVVVEYLVNGMPVVPDAGTIKLLAWNHDAALIKNEVYTPDPDRPPTQLEAVMDVALGSVGAGRVFETRYLRVEFEWNDKPYFVLKAYRLHPMVPMTVTTDSVRSLIGADLEEIRDDEIDVMGAYVSLVSTVGSSFTTALSLPNATSIAANDVIALRAALDFLPSLQTRLLKLEKTEASGYQRSEIDFLKLENDLRARYTDKLSLVSVGLGGTVTVVAVPTLFVVTKQTDPVTNS